MNTTRRSAARLGGAITIFYQFIVRGGGAQLHVRLAQLGRSRKEGIGSDPGLVTLAQYNDPAFDAGGKTLAKEHRRERLFALMDTLPRTDVLFGSIVSLGAANNQQRDIIMVKQHLKPKIYYPGHVDAVAQPGSALYHKINWRETATKWAGRRANGRNSGCRSTRTTSWCRRCSIRRTGAGIDKEHPKACRSSAAESESLSASSVAVGQPPPRW